MSLVNLEPQNRMYEYSFGGKKVSLSYDERHLYVREESSSSSTNRPILLELLMDKASESVSSNADDAEAISGIRQSWLFMLGAIVFFFSDLNDSIPLLSPALALVGVLKFYANMRNTHPHKYLAIESQIGRTMVTIPLPEKPEEVMERARLQAFINGLLKAIEHSRARRI